MQQRRSGSSVATMQSAPELGFGSSSAMRDQATYRLPHKVALDDDQHGMPPGHAQSQPSWCRRRAALVSGAKNMRLDRFVISWLARRLVIYSDPRRGLLRPLGAASRGSVRCGHDPSVSPPDFPMLRRYKSSIHFILADFCHGHGVVAVVDSRDASLYSCWTRQVWVRSAMRMRSKVFSCIYMHLRIL